MIKVLISASWISASPLLEGVIYPGFAWVGYRNKVYVGAGLNDPTFWTFSYLTQVYDPVNNTWSTAANVLNPLWVVSGAAISDSFYLFGGEDPSGPSYSNGNRRLDIGLNSWNFKAPLPSARAGLGSASFLGKIYLVGGYNNCGWLSCSVYNDLWEYDPVSNTYTTKSPAPSTVAEGVFISSEPFAQIGLFYVPGYSSINWGTPNLVNTIYYYDPLTDTWGSISTYPAPARYQLGAVFLPDTSIWVIGGADELGTVYANVDRCKLNLSITSCDWYDYNPPDLPAGRDALVVSLVDTTPPRPDSISVDTSSASCRIIVNIDTINARRRILVAGGSDGSYPQTTAWTLVSDTLDITYFLSTSTYTKTYTRNPSPPPGYFGPISDTFLISVLDTDTVCIDSLLIRERETGFKYKETLGGECIVCYPLSNDNELGMYEKGNKDPQEDFEIKGEFVWAYRYVEIFSPLGKVIFRGKGKVRLRKGVYFVRTSTGVKKVVVR